jgi:RNA polymerase primary sigma factor
VSKISFDTQHDDAYESYIKSIKRVPLLSAKEESELARCASAGDKKAVLRLVEANLRLVVKLGQKYLSAGVSLMDIIQEGNIGLMHAVEKFNSNKNVRFASYAALWIKQAIDRFVVSHCHTIRLPIKKEYLLREIHVAENVLHQKLGRAPKIDEIAGEVGCSVCDIEMINNIASIPLSFEAESNGPNGGFLAKFCEDDRRCNPEHEFLARSSRNETRRFLKTCLNMYERNVILHRFRFIDSDIHTFQKLGDTMGLTAEAVRQIEKRALNKIRVKRDELLKCVYA